MKINEDLRAELLRMADEDLTVRNELLEAGELEQGYHNRMAEGHEKNNSRMKAIIDQYGWPGRSLVSSDGAEAAWLIVQHAVLEPEFQRRCLGPLTEASRVSEAEPWQLALLTDRVLWSEGKNQIYGSQYIQGEDGEMAPYPIEDPEHVNERRRAIGLCSLEENTERIRREHREARRIYFARQKERESKQV